MSGFPRAVNRVRRATGLPGLVLLACISPAALASSLISGAVENKTHNRAAAGVQVIVLRLDQGMQEETRTITDDLGAFTVKVQFPEKPYLVRVMHQGVNYDRQAAAGDALTLEIFDSAPRVRGVTGGMEIIRTGSSGNRLHVSDMIEIRNDSNPPVTQAGQRTLDVYLPTGARVDSVMAATAGNIGVLIKASPVSGDPGHYTIAFPLRPGSSKFAFNYDLPYDGHAAFHTRLAYPFQQLAVMIPPSMKFASRSPAFEMLDTGSKEYQVAAANNLKAGRGPSFEITGAGAKPLLQSRVRPRASAPAMALVPDPGAPATNSSPQSPAKVEPRSAVPPAATTPPVNEWWIVGAAAGLVLVACVFLFWRMSRQIKREAKIKPLGSTGQAQVAGASSTSLLTDIKQQLLDIETARLEGSLSPEEYSAAKLALERTVKRAVARSTAVP